MAAFRVYLDTNIFIYAFENNDTLAKKLLQVIAANRGREQPFLATSAICLAEVMVDPLRKGNAQLIELYDNLCSGNAFIQIGEVSRSVLWHAAQLRSEYAHLRLPDAIHLSTAMQQGCARFLTADARLNENYRIALNPLVPDLLTADVSIIRPDVSVLDNILGEIEP